MENRRSPHPFKGLCWGQGGGAEAGHGEQEECRQNAAGGYEPGVMGEGATNGGGRGRNEAVPSCLLTVIFKGTGMW